jgi:hypothetical protein
MLTSQQVCDRCCENERPTVAEVASHFEGTIFWNWALSVGDGLDDQQRVDVELPLTVHEADPNEDGEINRQIWFESGECSIPVATAHEGRSDETARDIDAHFIANLPVYVPALFRRIKELEAANDTLKQRCELLEGDVSIEGKRPWEFCCEWYRPEETHRCIQHRFIDDKNAIPANVRSEEFAAFLCEQYRLAMNKGIQIGRGWTP